jgi:hypothetical protein
MGEEAGIPGEEEGAEEAEEGGPGGPPVLFSHPLLASAIHLSLSREAYNLVDRQLVAEYVSPPPSYTCCAD